MEICSWATCFLGWSGLCVLKECLLELRGETEQVVEEGRIEVEGKIYGIHQR